MCGLAGIFRISGCTDLDVDCVRRMNCLQKHRGPDDEGIFHNSNCVLGHRRLSIIDLSSAGHQPFFSNDGRYALVFNGEIYNYLELRKELQSHYACSFSTKTDTEVLLKAYIQFGPDCLSRFNGMFAFAIYDNQERTLFLARDRVGIKPLYYINYNDALIFASEIKAFFALPDFHTSLNNQALFDYLIFNRTDVDQETFLNEVSRLSKGCYAVCNDRGFSIVRWWDPETYSKQCEDSDPDRIKQKVGELLVDAVRLRMRSDVPVGSCLSGGLDSSILTGILFEHHKVAEKYKTFTAAFPGSPIDETAYIDDLRKQYQFQNIRTYPNATGALQNIEKFVYANDEPTTNPSFYSQYEVMRLAREHGVSVLLDGQGGDEIFAGYQYFHGFHLYGLLKQKKGGSFIKEFIQSLMRRQHFSAYQVLLFQLLPPNFQKLLLLRSVPYIDRDFFDAYIEKSVVFKRFFNVDGLNQSLLRHFQYKLEHLLRMEDRNSMAFSIEARVPYLDYRLVEYTMGLPEGMKINNGETKYLQKIALGHYTTDTILNRRDKIGFGTPGEEWMQSSEWQSMTEENYREMKKYLPEVFQKNVTLPDKGFDRWKINQLSIWKRLFLN
jgi:asparagine synthase (glutamine-hydrolysing)